MFTPLAFKQPQLVTNGLVLYLDAADRTSYVSGSTVWRDLSAGNNGTLTNGPTFDTGNGGSIVFDGADDYISTNTNSTLTQAGSTQFTAEFWIKKTASDKDSMVGAWNNSDRKGWFLQWYSDSIIYFGITDGSYNYNYINQAYQNQWFHIVGVFNGSESTNQTKAKIYVNGILLTTNNNNNILTSVPSNIVELTIGKLTNYSSFTTGNISTVKIYNRALSASEVQQNFNAQRQRFNI